MAVTISKPINLGGGYFEITVSSSLGAGTIFYWRVDSERYHSGPETTLMVFIAPGTSPLISISDTGWGNDWDFFPGRAKKQIFIDESSSPAYEKIRITDGADVVLAEIPSDGHGWYYWESDWLADVTTHTFKVIPIGANGNAGTTTTRTIFMVRNPDAPDVSWAYSTSTDKVTISAA